MKESCKIALSYIRSNAEKYSIEQDFSKIDIHIHAPEGAVPKDGPSAGIAMTLAILSAFIRIPVSPDIAFTGEVSLCGDLLPIGGLYEKSLAAKEAGVAADTGVYDAEKGTTTCIYFHLTILLTKRTATINNTHSRTGIIVKQK